MKRVEDLVLAYDHRKPVPGGNWRIELYFTKDRSEAALRRSSPTEEYGTLETTWRGPLETLRQAFHNADQLTSGERRITLEGCTSRLLNGDKVGATLRGEVQMDLPAAAFATMNLELNGTVVH